MDCSPSGGYFGNSDNNFLVFFVKLPDIFADRIYTKSLFLEANYQVISTNTYISKSLKSISEQMRYFKFGRDKIPSHNRIQFLIFIRK